MKRINSIDVVRGIVMIIMALDHVRDLIHVNAITQNPTDLKTTTPILFFTRWITHLCAPTFVFLAGTSVYLSTKNSGVAENRAFLFKRGIWLIILEFTLVNFALWFDLSFRILLFEVIATIGAGFIILGLLLKLSPKTLGIIGLVIIFGHNLFPLIPFGEGSIVKSILTPLLGPTGYPLGATTFVMAYPPVPWLGIMLVGYAAGQIFELDGETRKKRFLQIGAAALGLFVILRLINVYGDPAPWSYQADALYTAISFFNLTKYPPSLLFCLTMLGIMFLLLGLTENARNKLADIAAVYGRVPLFYFIVHLYLIHFILLIVLVIQGIGVSAFDFSSGTFGRPKDVPTGLDLWVIYLLWAGVVAALYLPCLWYGRYKSAHKDKTWPKYL